MKTKVQRTAIFVEKAILDENKGTAYRNICRNDNVGGGQKVQRTEIYRISK